MGNSGNKPLTAEGDAPAPEEKPVESTSRDVELEETKEEEKKPEGTVEAVKPAEEPPVVETAKAEVSEPKPEETKPVAVEEKKVETLVAKV